MNKPISPDIVIAHSQCPRKAYLLLCTKTKGTPHEYTLILEEEKNANRERYLQKIASKAAVQPYNGGLEGGSDFVSNAILMTDDLEATCDLLTKVDGRSALGRYSYEPTIFVGTHSVSKFQKLRLFFVGYVLGKVQNRFPEAGRIIDASGKSHKIKLENGKKMILPILELLREWKTASGKKPPPVILNKHCPYCPFREACRTKAEETDHLSLLSRISEKEIKKLNEKGIFTVTQLAYTYRPRKQRKGRTNRSVKYHHSLKALAIRDNRVYVVHTPEVVSSSTRIFLDVEGIPDQDFYYLIGLLIEKDSNVQQISLWADEKRDEASIWKQLLDVFREIEDFTIFHYGRYETRFINKMSKAYGQEGDPVLTKIESNLVNVLTLIYGHIYFPTYSNSLKDIGSFLDQKWSKDDASGLQSLVWRYKWEVGHEDTYRSTLITYNQEDCLALKRVTEAVFSICQGIELDSGTYEVSSVEDVKKKSTYKFGKNDFLFKDLELVNQSAYFDYQREKVYFRNRKRKALRPINLKSQHRRKYRINKHIHFSSPAVCLRCGSIILYKHDSSQKTQFDLRFSRSGVKRWVVRYTAKRVRCRSCWGNSASTEYNAIRGKYGRNLQVWIIYNMIALRQPSSKLGEGLKGLFGYDFHSAVFIRTKKNMSDYYRITYENVLDKLRNGNLVHADETTANVRGVNAYVWVFTSLEEVAYVYSPTREAEVLKRHLDGFKGVLVSDFYGAYDSMECPQQKCLIHLIRDMNDDLRKNPFDEEYKVLIQDFGKLLKKIIVTIDKYGLKKRHLRKHRKDTDRLFRKLSRIDYQSEVSIKYKRRLEKYKGRLFTFLDYDDVPWNNNNAEHAIKAFALYRKIANGCFTEEGLQRYLVLLSVYKTCKYKNIDYLHFLLSGATDIEEYTRRRTRIRGGRK